MPRDTASKANVTPEAKKVRSERPMVRISSDPALPQPVTDDGDGIVATGVERVSHDQRYSPQSTKVIVDHANTANGRRRRTNRGRQRPVIAIRENMRRAVSQASQVLVDAQRLSYSVVVTTKAADHY